MNLFFRVITVIIGCIGIYYGFAAEAVLDRIFSMVAGLGFLYFAVILYIVRG